MVESGANPNEVEVSFDLLEGVDVNSDEINVQDLTQEQQESLYRLMDQVNLSETMENNDDAQAFEKTVTKFRHARKSTDQVDEIAAEINKDATKWQTKWAVTVYKGNFEQSFFSSPFSDFMQKLQFSEFCSRQQNGLENVNKELSNELVTQNIFTKHCFRLAFGNK